MINDILASFPSNSSAEIGGYSFDMSAEPQENWGVSNSEAVESLKGKFRLINGDIFKVVEDPIEPGVSAFLELSEQERSDVQPNS